MDGKEYTVRVWLRQCQIDDLQRYCDMMSRWAQREGMEYPDGGYSIEDAIVWSVGPGIAALRKELDDGLHDGI